MKKKLVGIVIFMLVATTVVSATNIYVKETRQPTSSEVDVPVWEKDDSWTYDYHRMEYRYDGSTLWYTLFLNETFTNTVIDDTGDTYKIESISKTIEGRTTIGSYRLKFTPLTKVIDEPILRKTDLATIQEAWQIKGLVFWLLGENGIPFPAQYRLSAANSNTPAQVTLPFPLTAGASGTIPEYNWTFQEKCVLYWGLIKLIDNPDVTGTAGLLLYHCEMENVTVPTGTYAAYNVSIDYGRYHFWQYYVPEVGNVVKAYVSEKTLTGDPLYLIEYELIDYSYTP